MGNVFPIVHPVEVDCVHALVGPFYCDFEGGCGGCCCYDATP